MNIACYLRSNDDFAAVQIALKREGFECTQFTSDAALLRTLQRAAFDFIIVEMSADARDNESIISWMSLRTSDSTPLMVMSKDHHAEWVAQALNAGADDFLRHPVEAVELTARIHAICRRSQRRQSRRSIELAGFTIDRQTNSFSYRGEQIELTPREFMMVWLLFSSPGVYVSRDTLATTVWGIGSDIAGRTIEQHVYKLRKKLQLGAERGLIIRTAYNQGYRLEVGGQAVSVTDL